MLSQKEREQIIALVHQQVVPAIGCTEPICVALAVARSREVLECVPAKIEARLSANIIKNAMGVGIPGTGMVGLPIAIALGALYGRSCLELEVLRDCPAGAVEEGKSYIQRGAIHITLAEDAPDKLYVDITSTAPDGTTARVVAQAEYRLVQSGRHTYLYAPAAGEDYARTAAHLAAAGVIVLLVLGADAPRLDLPEAREWSALAPAGEQTAQAIAARLLQETLLDAAFAPGQWVI